MVHNAIDALAHVLVGRRALKVTTTSDGAKAIILEVEDSGPGIEPERLGGIFEAFVRLPSDGKNKSASVIRESSCNRSVIAGGAPSRRNRYRLFACAPGLKGSPSSARRAQEQ